ncbi:MAG TPA: tRNA 4-thiouridine(8) synthase ThiI [Spirochaetota bacterium]|nr:tRNA 4-thiouridine(8) synthase ThiI [Spirochaetota bacterium]
MKNTRGVVLFSGGLDSLLAAKVLQEQGIDLIGFHCILPFFPPDINTEELTATRQAKQIGLKLHHYFCKADYIGILKDPPHGYGSHMNPCIDCKIFFIKKAAEFMESIGADFVATGEVVGQRPMSQQKNTMRHIEKESGLEGKLLRPLSAKLLSPTIPELEGKVDRAKLLSISGRGRKQQMELAAKYNITDYSSPAGGCLFTDKFFASRLRDLLDFKSDIDQIDIYLLSIGRHYRISNKVKVIISKNELEGIELSKYRDRADLFIEADFKGPVIFVSGEVDDHKELPIILKIMSRYGKPDELNKKVYIKKNNSVIKEIEAFEPIEDFALSVMRI